MAKLKDDGKPRVDQVIERLVAQAPPLSDEAAKQLQRLVARPRARQR
jgi:hypothetical protein